MKLTKIHYRYPWFSALLGVVLAAFLYLSASEAMLSVYAVPPQFATPEARLLAVIAFGVVTIVDVLLFHRRLRRNNQLIGAYNARFDEMLKVKSQLQGKVQKYADHTDKLKLFISDRLLEYIEYDEKYLHFKNIAAEVRHSGVISYDKVMTALNAAMTTCDSEERFEFEDATYSMSYLWDLLDLSTTDNIALHIANHLYECEEHYYQRHLHPEDADIPYVPSFSMRRAVYRCLLNMVDPDEGGLPPLDDNQHAYAYQDRVFWVNLENVGELLGKENHLILLLENLINNALYYNNAPQYRSKHSRIAVQLKTFDKRASLSVYNRGPLIEEAVQDKIFQLGYSTKRSKEHNGKGLGLYFVNEIVKGYEGGVTIENVTNTPDTYVIRVELENGDKSIDIISTALGEGNRLYCSSADNSEALAHVDLIFNSHIRNVEVAVQSAQSTYTVELLGKGQVTEFLDPKTPARPQWYLKVGARGAANKITFKPLDIAGVQFNVSLPTAQSRIDIGFHEEEEEKRLGDIDALGENFADNQRYIE